MQSRVKGKNHRVAAGDYYEVRLQVKIEPYAIGACVMALWLLRSFLKGRD